MTAEQRYKKHVTILLVYGALSLLFILCSTWVAICLNKALITEENTTVVYLKKIGSLYVKEENKKVYIVHEIEGHKMIIVESFKNRVILKSPENDNKTTLDFYTVVGSKYSGHDRMPKILQNGGKQ